MAARSDAGVPGGAATSTTPGPEGQRREPGVRADAAGVLDLERQHRLGHGVRPRGHGLGAGLAVVEQHHRVGAAGLAVAPQHAAQRVHERLARGRGVADRARRADRGAAAAALAQVGIDLDALAHRADRLGGAMVQAARAAGLATAAVDADTGVVVEVARLVELADEARQRLQRRRQGRLVRGRVVARRELPALQGRGGADVEHQVEGRVLARPETGRQVHRGAAVEHRHAEGPEVALDGGHAAAQQARPERRRRRMAQALAGVVGRQHAAPRASSSSRRAASVAGSGAHEHEHAPARARR
ncbi:MAG: hypothetical protein U5K73_00700 [Halofilum sp. (in: g-proteobacteria)]|nr:hypothetical protein [Halofilum sp. (in: g-proteobacteria)]